ncbi:MAG: hypothetical protein ACREJ9_06660 [Candidatus Rokuibacteriota bacterium]
MIPRTMLTPETVQRVEQFWTAFFGCSRDDFGASRVLVVPHRGLAGYAGAWAFRDREACVLSVPPALVGEIAARGKEWAHAPNAVAANCDQAACCSAPYASGEAWRSESSPGEPTAERWSIPDPGKPSTRISGQPGTPL